MKRTNMKHHHFLLSIFLHFAFISYHCCEGSDDYDYDYYEDPYCWTTGYDKCSPKGYEVYRCNEAAKRHDLVKEVECSDWNSRCRCSMDGDDEYRCWCENPTEKPRFPETGIIRWNGTYDWAELHLSKIENFHYVPGEVHKDSQGRYMLKQTKVPMPFGPSSVKFEIIIPSLVVEGTFIKYTGDTSSKKCKRSTVKATKNLREVFKDTSNYSLRYTLFKTTPIVKKKDHVIQKWTQYLNDEDVTANWVYTLDYNKKTGYAVPLMNTRDWFDTYHSEKTNLKVKYQYQPITKEDEPTFLVEDYCDEICDYCNEKWR